MKKGRNRNCSFCRKTSTEIGPLVEGPGDVYICGECVELSQSIIEQETRRHSFLQGTALSPVDIQAKLDQFFTGQLEAKQALADAVYGHFARWSHTPVAGQASKSLILLLGPSRASKLFVARVLAHAIAVPFGQGHATLLQQLNPIAPDLKHPLVNLLNASGFDSISAQRGIVYLDGIDQPDSQAALSSMLAKPVAVLDGRLHLDTTNILFICGGEFEELGTSVPKGAIDTRELTTSRLSRQLADQFRTIVSWAPLDEQTSARITACVDLKDLSVH